MRARDEAMRLILRGKINDSAISKATGVPTSTVQYMRRRAGLSPVRSHEDARQRSEAMLAALEERPLTVRQIMARFGLSETAVRHHLGRLLAAERACIEDEVLVRGVWTPRWTVWPAGVETSAAPRSIPPS